METLLNSLYKLRLCEEFLMLTLTLKVNSKNSFKFNFCGIGSEVLSLFATTQDYYQFSLLWRIGLVGENIFHANFKTMAISHFIRWESLLLKYCRSFSLFLTRLLLSTQSYKLRKRKKRQTILIDIIFEIFANNCRFLKFGYFQSKVCYQGPKSSK